MLSSESCDGCNPAFPIRGSCRTMCHPGSRVYVTWPEEMWSGKRRLGESLARMHPAYIQSAVSKRVSRLNRRERSRISLQTPRCRRKDCCRTWVVSSRKRLVQVFDFFLCQGAPGVAQYHSSNPDRAGERASTPHARHRSQYQRFLSEAAARRGVSTLIVPFLLIHSFPSGDQQTCRLRLLQISLVISTP